jgi:hypothetical protein
MRLYSLLLHLYPSSFRAEYGEEMRAIFAKKWRDASSPLPRLALFLSALADVLGNALRAHAELLRQDARYTIRTLARSPGFAATVIVVTAPASSHRPGLRLRLSDFGSAGFRARRRSPEAPGGEERFPHGALLRRFQQNVGCSLASPAALDGLKRFGVDLNEELLLVRRELHHAQVRLGNAESREDLSAHSKVRMTHVGRLDDLR